MFGDGKNVIPLIHLSDLAQFVKRIVLKKFKQHYIFAIDDAILQQKTLVKTIAETIGAGRYRNVSIAEGSGDEDFLILTCNIWAKPTRFVTPEEETYFEEDIVWNCKDGFVKNIWNIEV